MAKTAARARHGSRPTPAPTPTAAATATPADEITAELRAAGQPERAVTEKAYLKSDLDFFGVGVPAARAIVRAWCRSHPDLSHDELTAVAASLWVRPDYECRMAAQMLLIQNPALLGPADIPQLEQILRQARTWALVDGLTCDLMGPLVERYPELTGVLDRWAADPISGFAARPCSRSCCRCAGGPVTSSGSPATPTRCWTNGNSSSARPSAGSCARRPSSAPPWSPPGWSRAITRLSGVTLREAVKPLPEPTRAALLALRQAG